MDFEAHFIKGSDFKTVQGSGVFGGLTSSGQINMNFFTDRAPIPTRIVLDVDPNTGKVLGEKERETKNGIVREVHFGVLMDINTAKSTVEWLSEKIKQFEEANNQKP